MFVRWLLRDTPYVLNDGVPSAIWTRVRREQQWAAGDTHIFSSHLDNNFRFGLGLDYMADGGTQRGVTPPEWRGRAGQHRPGGLQPKQFDRSRTSFDCHQRIAADHGRSRRGEVQRYEYYRLGLSRLADWSPRMEVRLYLPALWNELWLRQ